MSKGTIPGAHIDYRAMWLEAERDLDELRRSLATLSATRYVQMADLGQDSRTNLIVGAMNDAAHEVAASARAHMIRETSTERGAMGETTARVLLTVCRMPPVLLQDKSAAALKRVSDFKFAEQLHIGGGGDVVKAIEGM